MIIMVKIVVMIMIRLFTNKLDSMRITLHKLRSGFGMFNILKATSVKAPPVASEM